MTVSSESRTALVLAGGGVTGAVYELGALRALNEMLLDRTVNDFDIYIGTSAGSLICSLLANGISAETLMQANAGSHPDIPPLRLSDYLQLSYKELLLSGARIPNQLLRSGLRYLGNAKDNSLFDFFWTLLDVLPPGIYDGIRLDRYLRKILSERGCANDFRALERELYIIATDLDTGERAVFGQGYEDQVPISMAVAASTALPVFYKPVRIHGREYVDGGLRGTASLDLAIEHGANLVICINPLVPFDNRSQAISTRANKGEPEHLSDRGLTVVASQVTRINTHSGLHYHIKQLRRSHPEVDILLIEPRADDPIMFSENMMGNSTRLTIAQHGFESVTIDLVNDYPFYKEILSRHQIPITSTRVQEELSEIQGSGYNPRVIRKVLEARPRRKNKISQLHETLSDLDGFLSSIGSTGAANQSLISND